jgi:hypothetical protein
VPQSFELPKGGAKTVIQVPARSYSVIQFQ